MNGRLRLAVALVACALFACGGEDSSTARDRPLPGTTPRPTGTGGTASSTAGTGSNAFGNTNRPPPVVDTTPNGQIPSDVCEKVRVTADPQTPDMLIVLDRSGSMEEGRRWEPSVAALRNVTMQLQSEIRFGMAMFPDPTSAGGGGLDCLFAADPQACENQARCGVGKIVVEPALDAAAAIGMALSNTQPRGGTPTPDTLNALLETYGGTAQEDPDAPPARKFILLVTDGQPTCPTGNGQDVNPTDINNSNLAIEALAAKGIPTYVIGYDTNTPGNEDLATVLDGFAVRGGTGDMQHHPVEDEASLVAVLESITAKVASCTYQLAMKPPRADFVRVTVDGQQINLDDANGWRLVGDTTVELTGAACASLMTTTAHQVEVEVDCEVVPPI